MKEIVITGSINTCGMTDGHGQDKVHIQGNVCLRGSDTVKGNQGYKTYHAVQWKKAIPLEWNDLMDRLQYSYIRVNK
jgi:hypothetical protein